MNPTLMALRATSSETSFGGRVKALSQTWKTAVSSSLPRVFPEILPQHLIAFAGHLLNRDTIVNDDLSTIVGDGMHSLEEGGGNTDPCAPDADSVGDVFLGKRQIERTDAVIHHQQPDT